MAPRAFDALLFDLGGVVVGIDWDRMFARWAYHAGEEPNTIRARFSFDTPYARHERGEIGASEYFASLRSSLRIDLSDDQFLDGWTAIYAGEILGMRELLRSLRDRIPLYAFTNSNPAHTNVWTKLYAETLKNFRRIFVSSDMGVRKPEPKAFEKVAAAIGVPLSRILFFDDTNENVESARAVGMQAMYVISHQGIAETIAHSVGDLQRER